MQRGNKQQSKKFSSRQILEELYELSYNCEKGPMTNFLKDEEETLVEYHGDDMIDSCLFGNLFGDFDDLDYDGILSDWFTRCEKS